MIDGLATITQRLQMWAFPTNMKSLPLRSAPTLAITSLTCWPQCSSVKVDLRDMDHM